MDACKAASAELSQRGLRLTGTSSKVRTFAISLFCMSMISCSVRTLYNTS